MKSGYTVGYYGTFLYRLYSGAYKIAKGSAIKGRFLSIPLGISLMISIPGVKIISFVEDICFVVINIMGAAWNEGCSLKDAMRALSKAMQHSIGFLLSPLIGLFVGVSVISSVIVSPVKALKMFAETCLTHPSRASHSGC